MIDTRPHELVFDHYDPADEARRQALFALGNGVLSWRAGAVDAPGHYQGLYHAGWYDNAPRQVNGTSVDLEALVNLPDPFGLSVSVDGEQWFDLDQVPLLGYRQTLNLDLGELHRSLEFLLGDQLVQVNETRLVSMHQPELLLLRWEVRAPSADVDLHVRSVLNAGVVNGLVERDQAYEGQRLQGLVFSHDAAGRAAVVAHLHEPQRKVQVHRQIDLSLAHTPWQTSVESHRVVQHSRCRVAQGQALTIDLYAQVTLDGAPAQPRLGQFAELRDAHWQAWQALWRQMPLRLDDPALERTLNFAAFHLLQTTSPLSVGRDQGFPARGWQEGYFGQIFWDEILAFGFLGSHFPELATHLLTYRYKRLDGARQAARAAGYQGAMYPWRSAIDGTEQTPPFQYNPLSGRWMADPTYLQRHVGAAIAYDVWTLFLATGDTQLLAGMGGEILLEVARFWSSIAEYDPGRDRYVIRGIIGPDEYHTAYPGATQPGLDNNAYTNVMAAWTLHRALDCLRLLPTSEAAALSARLGLSTEETRHWTTLTRRLYVPFMDDGVMNLFEGYETLARAPAGWSEDGMPRLDWLLEKREDSCNHYQLTKQADVLMLLHLFAPADLIGLLGHLGYAFDLDTCERTARFHMERITHESSLSAMVCAGALTHYAPEESWANFRQCLSTDLHAPSDSGTVEGVHLGSMAGSLDVLQRHYLGLRPALDGLHVFPAPPAGLQRAEVRLQYRGSGVYVQLQGERLRLTLDAEAASIDIVHHEGGHTLQAGACLELAGFRQHG